MHGACSDAVARNQTSPFGNWLRASPLPTIAIFGALDETLDQVGAREGLAEIQKTHLDELLKLVPEHLKL